MLIQYFSADVSPNISWKSTKKYAKQLYKTITQLKRGLLINVLISENKKPQTDFKMISENEKNQKTLLTRPALYEFVVCEAQDGLIKGAC